LSNSQRYVIADRDSSGNLKFGSKAVPFSIYHDTVGSVRVIPQSIKRRDEIHYAMVIFLIASYI